MSWSLEVFSPNEQHAQSDELETCLREAALKNPEMFGLVEGGDLRVVFRVEDDPQNQDSAQTWVLSRTGPDKTSSLGFVQMQRFDEETRQDPKLLETLEHEIEETDEEDGDTDHEYSKRVQAVLESAKWHYIVWVGKNDRPTHQKMVLQTAYVLSKMSGGIVHDLQSGAWMDAEIFESLLDAYVVEDVAR